VPLKLYCAQKNLFSAYNKNKNLAPLSVFSPKNLKTLLRACCNMDETFHKYFVKACNFRGTLVAKFSLKSRICVCEVVVFTYSGSVLITSGSSNEFP